MLGHCRNCWCECARLQDIWSENRCFESRCWSRCNLYNLCEWIPEVRKEVTIGVKKIEEWWGRDVRWIIHVNVEGKNDGKSTLGEEGKEPGAGSQEVCDNITLGKGL